MSLPVDRCAVILLEDKKKPFITLMWTKQPEEPASLISSQQQKQQAARVFIGYETRTGVGGHSRDTITPNKQY